MSNGRNNKKRVSGFDRAAQALTEGLSPEATKGFTSMVKDVAQQYGYNDSIMIRRLRARLKRTAQTKGSWAGEVLERLERLERLAKLEGVSA